jgi:hypothetical protein
MIPDRDYVLAKAEVERRRRVADEERVAREARRNREPAATTQPDQLKHPRGPLGWLRRLASARH